MGRSEREIGLAGRLAVAFLGLYLVGWAASEGGRGPLGPLVAAAGLIILLSACGVIELAMALYYRSRSRRTKRPRIEQVVRER